MLSLTLFTSMPYKTEYIAPPVEDIILVGKVDKEDMPILIEFYANKWNVSQEQLNGTIKCESGYNPDAVNMSDSHKLSQGSHGVAQFSRETFKHYAKEINPTYSDPYNPREAIDVMAYMFHLGEERQWTCWRKLYK